MAGVTENGIDIKRLDEVKNDMEKSLQANFGQQIKLNPQSTFGSEVNAHSRIQAKLWEILEDVHGSRTLKGATGVQLDELGAIIGRKRLDSIPSTAVVDLTGVAETIIPKFFEYRDTAGNIWSQDIDITLDAGGLATVAVTSISPIPVSTASNTIINIVEPLTGLNTVSNPNPAIVGQAQESDPEYRVRLFNSARGSSKGVYDALQDSMIEVKGVTYSSLEENVTNAVDTLGLDPHSFMNIVEGGSDIDVATKIWEHKPAGIATNGTTEVIIKDSTDKDQTIKFQRPTLKDILIVVNLTPTGSWDGTREEAIKTALEAFGALNLSVGDDVINSQLYSPVNQINGHSIREILIDIDPTVPTVSDDIAISVTERAVISADRVTVNVV